MRYFSYLIQKKGGGLLQNKLIKWEKNLTPLHYYNNTNSILVINNYSQFSNLPNGDKTAIAGVETP